MSNELFNVVFAGELLAPDKQAVIQKFAELFKLPLPQAEQILSSRRKVLKKSVPHIKANAFQKRLAAIGVLVSLERVDVDLETLLTLEPEEETTDPTADTAPTADNVAPLPEKAEENPWAEVNADDLAVDKAALEDGGDGAIHTHFSLADDPRKVRHEVFSFTGDGVEYFKIWIVNIFLTIVTLGIYSAWAKVRTNKYFYGNTWLDKSAFEYLADPIQILKGRLVAAVLLVIYVSMQQFNPSVAAGLFLVFLLVLPFFVMMSLRFRMRNTAYRNIRFGFEGTLWGAAKAYTAMFLLMPFTLGLLFPYMMFLQTRYKIDNTKYGTDLFSFNVSPRAYYKIYLLAFLAMLTVVIVAAGVSAAAPLHGAIVALVGYPLIISFVQVQLLNVMFDNTLLGDHQFSSKLEVGGYFRLQFINTVAIVLTLGLFYPWAKVRVARYRADHLWLITQGSLDNYVAEQREENSALGEEVGDMFDIDIGI